MFLLDCGQSYGWNGSFIQEFISEVGEAVLNINPWMASIYGNVNYQDVFQGTGVLISDYWVVTTTSVMR